MAYEPVEVPPALVDALLGDELPGARCRGQDPELFDEWLPNEAPAARVERIATALRICGDCPVRGPCAELYSSMPKGRADPGGVWGGRLRVTTSRPPR